MKKSMCIVLLCILCLFTACSKKPSPKEETPKEETAQKTEQKKEPQEPVVEPDPLEGKEKSVLTGLYIDKEAANRRPVAVMINNLHKALPQSGIAQAEIFYEALAEGEITRILAVFSEFDEEKIGPVRSARSYFTYFALDHNAVFVHHGGSETGYSAIRKRGIDAIDGMTDNAAFWRDKKRANQPGMYEHSSYVSAQKILEGCKNRGFHMDLSKKEGMFLFYEEDAPEKGDDAAQIIIPYSSYQISQFQYDENKKQYIRSQSGSLQIDEQTNQSLEVKNVIVQFADTVVVDNEGRRDISLVAKGEGIYFTNGKALNIKWQKDSYNTPTRWYLKEGKELFMNPGKTFVCVCPTGLLVEYK